MRQPPVQEHPPEGAAATRSATAQVIARRIRVALAERDSNVSKLGDELGLNRNYLPRRMGGHTDWRIDELLMVANHLGVDITALIADPVDRGEVRRV